MHPLVEVLADGQAWTVRVRDAIGDHSIRFERLDSAEAYAVAQRTRLGLPDDASTDAYLAEGSQQHGERRA